ncbi:cytochrome c oxidase subunit 3 [Paraburkholderia silvatlantica]|uniref:cytochrome c oxidase subunit 3 n=1 Tax=Paraburkholderia silvatlantica TaxID=321895 RepID=UPI00105CBD44|nr:heme/copper-type cytochrome/quinol oxidase subunit 3 [Paraburkholderia silvatlantica]
MPEDSYAPFVLGVASTFMFVGLLFHSTSFTALAGLACGLALLSWLWPRRSPGQREPFAPQGATPAGKAAGTTAIRSEDETLALPVGSAGEHAGGWWGVLTLVVTESALFGYLIFSYLYLASQSAQPWPPEGLPKLGMSGPNTALLLTSSVFVWLAGAFVRRARSMPAFWSMIVGIALGAAFVTIQCFEWHDRPYGLATNLYGSLYFTITGFHVAHVMAGLLMLAALAFWIARGYFDGRRDAALTIGGLYWHFVDVVWLVIFSVLYLSPYWMRGR